MGIADRVCVFTNGNLTLESLDADVPKTDKSKNPSA